MRTSLTQYGVLAAAVVAASALSMGCNKDKANARTDSAAAAVGATTDTAAASTARRADSAATRATNGWTDAQVLAYAAAASNGEIREGQLAERKATNPAVKAFARQMVTDHQALLTQGKTFASKNHVTPDTTKSDVTDLMKDSRDEIKDLTDKKAGADWDKDYIDKQIDDHKHLLDKLQDAAKSTQNADLRTMLEKASGKVQEHLTKAQDIKDNKLKS